MALGVLAVVAGGLAISFDSRPAAKTITMRINGLAWQTATTATDVAELLLQLVGDYDGLTIEPAPETLLTDQMTIDVRDNQTSALDRTVAANLRTELNKAAEAKAAAEPKSPIHSGLATWYDFGSGLTTASRQFPKGTRLKVVAVNSGRSVEVVVNDYGPEALTGIALDLNRPAFAALAPLGAGKIQVKYFKI